MHTYVHIRVRMRACLHTHLRTQVQRLADEGICKPEDIAAVTDAYLNDEDEDEEAEEGTPRMTPATAGGGGRAADVRAEVEGRFMQARRAAAEDVDGDGGAGAGALVVQTRRAEWSWGEGDAGEQALVEMAEALGVRSDIATRRGLVDEIEAGLEGAGYGDLRYETAQESWEIFARELLRRFEVFWRGSYGLQQYARAKKRAVVLRTALTHQLDQRDVRIADLEQELARMRALAAGGDEEHARLAARMQALQVPMLL